MRRGAARVAAATSPDRRAVVAPAPDVALIGYGHWGRNLGRNFAALGALKAVCEVGAEARRAAAAAHPDAEVADEVAAVLASPVRAVVLATPAASHYALARRALLAGKDVFCEKPLALDYAEGAELVALARRRSAVLMVGHVLEYHPGILALRRLVAEGALGEIRYIYSNRLSLGRVRREENILWSFAPHDIAVILRLTGQRPLSVVACGGTYVTPQVADVTVTHLRFPDGVGAHIHVSWLHPFKEQRLVVVGSAKMATFDDVAKRLTLHDQRVDADRLEPTPFKGPGQEIAFEATEPLRLECEAFLQAVRSRDAPLTDGESALRVLAVLAAAQRSLERGGEPQDLAGPW